MTKPIKRISYNVKHILIMAMLILKRLYFKMSLLWFWLMQLKFKHILIMAMQILKYLYFDFY